NGAGIVHDFELAVAGNTSEDVSAGLGSGEFGMARETGEEINRAIVEGDRDGLGLGAAVGRYLLARKPPHLEVSLLAAAAPHRRPAARASPRPCTWRWALTPSTCTPRAPPRRSAGPPTSTSPCSRRRSPAWAGAASTSTSARR